MAEKTVKVLTITMTIIVITTIVIAISIHWNLLPFGNQDRYGYVNVQRAKELIDSKPNLVILDLRNQSEYDSTHIAGSILIPISELEERIDELKKEDELLVYCNKGKRTSKAVSILKANDYTQVYYVAGGIKAWENAGLPTAS
jgi:rhodanese-related sulfurtransferase